MICIYLMELYGKKIDSTYRLVIAVIKRAKELYQGALPKIRLNKLTLINTIPFL